MVMPKPVINNLSIVDYPVSLQIIIFSYLLLPRIYMNKWKVELLQLLNVINQTVLTNKQH